MFEKSNAIRNDISESKGIEKPANQEAKGLKFRVEWEEKAQKALPEDYRRVVTEALEYIEEEKLGGSLVISGAECVKEDFCPVTIKLKSHDWVNYIDWEIKIVKYREKWKFISISQKGGEALFDPEEE